MKNLILSFMLIPIGITAQIKVHSTGNVTVGGEVTPRAVLDINKNTSNSTTSQFGTFGIQSLGLTNGFLLANGFWNGTALQAYNDGAINVIQFNRDIVRIRTTPSVLSGATTSDLQDNITAIYGGGLGAIVGINTMTPSGYNLYVQGTAFKSDGNSSWSVASDKRLKENIVQFKEGLDIINKVNVVEFEYNGKGGTKKGEKHIGVIAQEIQEIAPFMISEFEFIESSNENENNQKSISYLSYNDSSLPYLLVNAVKSQQKQIEILMQENQLLKAKLEQILILNNLNTLSQTQAKIE